MRRLASGTLAELPANLERPAYDRDATAMGVVHLGLGAFHRAHQGAVFDAALASGDPRWGIVGVSLRSADVRDQLEPQDGLYTVVGRDGAECSARVIGAIRKVLVAPDDPRAVVDALARVEVNLVTLTVTEKGYKLVGAAIDRGDPDVAHDLLDLTAPRTAAGFLVAGLDRRRQRGVPPFTTVSCDNLPDNGGVLRNAVLEIAEAHDSDLAAWIAQGAAFPKTMVDRIVPATTEADRLMLAERLGVEDQAMVKTEPYWQWVIEDRFSGPRPAFEGLGVQLTEEIAPWEDAKLRLLNGAHSAIAYLGGLAGIEFVHEFVGMPEGQRLIEALWDESAATLRPPANLDLSSYRAALMQRFANHALEHRTGQIAMDGSQKIPQRLVRPALLLLEKGAPCNALALAIAAWMRWQGGVDDASQAVVIDDPLRESLSAALGDATSTEERVDALLRREAIFPEVLQRSPLRALLVRFLGLLERHGALETIRRILDEGSR